MKIKKYKINQRNRLKIYEIENEVEFRTPESYLENKKKWGQKKKDLLVFGIPRSLNICRSKFMCQLKTEMPFSLFCLQSL